VTAKDESQIDIRNRKGTASPSIQAMFERPPPNTMTRGCRRDLFGDRVDGLRKCFVRGNGKAHIGKIARRKK